MSLIDATMQAVIDAAINFDMKRILTRMQKMIENRQDDIVSESRDERDSQEKSRLSELSNIDAVDDNDDQPRWHVENIEFFDSYYEGKSTSTTFVMKYVEKDIYFRDVHVFIDRAKDLASSSKEWEMIRINLSICLRGQALIWYIFELFDDERRLLKYDNNLDE